MKERPILFSGPMVRAILDGRKTQTRRVVKAKALPIDGDWTLEIDGSGNAALVECIGNSIATFPISRCPYGQPGDRLWVRETWSVHMRWNSTKPRYIDGDRAEFRWFAADGREKAERQRCGRWRPSIHMPRWVSRLTLDVTDVRVERVQNISASDAVAEGVFCDGECHTEPPLPYPVATFKKLWDSINAKRGYPWDENPWVWVVSFRRVS